MIMRLRSWGIISKGIDSKDKEKNKSIKIID